MEAPQAVPKTVLKEGLVQLVRFCAVGAIGFVVDCGLLAALTSGEHLGPFTARAISFPAAVFATFILNRYWAFPPSRLSFARAFTAYIGVQASGLTCNALVYSGAMLMVPSSYNAPITCLALASAAALAVNFLGARAVFAYQRT